MSCCIKRMQGAGDHADVHSECDWQYVRLTSAKICCIHLQEVCILWTRSHPMYLYILFWLSFDRSGSVCCNAKRWSFSIACWKIHMDGGRGVPWKSICGSNGSRRSRKVGMAAQWDEHKEQFCIMMLVRRTACAFCVHIWGYMFHHCFSVWILNAGLWLF